MIGLAVLGAILAVYYVLIFLLWPDRIPWEEGQEELRRCKP